jgi:type II secretory pathway predicted ATPase ExeA
MASGGHREAASRCLHLIERRSGCGVICGEPGVGKTLVLRRLVRRAARLAHRACYVDLNGIDRGEFQWRLCAALRLSPSTSESRAQLWARLTDALDGAQNSQLSLAVLFDHADAAHADVLPELRRWLQLADDQRRTVTVVATRSPIPAALAAVLTDFCDLRADVHRLSAEETTEFIRRVSELDSAAMDLNQSEAAAALHELTAGEPRKLQRLCRLAALAAAAEDGATLDRPALEALVNELLSLNSRPSGIIPRP